MPAILLWAYVFALAAGVSFVFQQAVNANLRGEISSAWWAGFVSYLGGTIVMLLIALALREPWPSMQVIARSHWLSWTGGGLWRDLYSHFHSAIAAAWSYCHRFDRYGANAWFPRFRSIWPSRGS